jgi:hypothetical protein
MENTTTNGTGILTRKPNGLTGKTVNRIFRCKKCGTTHTISMDQNRRFRLTNRWGSHEYAYFLTFKGHEHPDNGNVPEYTAASTCETCGKRMGFGDVKGSTNDQPCGSKCLTSKGHVCSCSCGGKNHGAGFMIVGAA